MKRNGYTLVATMITVAIMLMLMMVFMTGGLGGNLQKNTGAKPRADGRGTTIPGLAIARAEDEACKSNLRQARAGIQLAMVGSDTAPESLQDAGIGESFYRCPLGSEPYEYDRAAAGHKVKCVHLGHEKY